MYMYVIHVDTDHCSGDGVMESIWSRFTLRTKGESRYTDIYDGRVYQQHVASGFLSQRDNISMIFNTDGVPVFRSSNFAFWPQYLLINELPSKIRYTCSTCKLCYMHVRYAFLCIRAAKENRLLAGLWYGAIKPEMTLFLKPMAKALQRLHTEGTSLSACAIMC